jgi:hypothetical protein
MGLEKGGGMGNERLEFAREACQGRFPKALYPLLISTLKAGRNSPGAYRPISNLNGLML